MYPALHMNGATDELSGLFFNGFNDPVVAVANIGDAVAANAIDIFFTIGVPDLGAFSADEHKVALGIDVELIGLFQFYEIAHWTMVPLPLKAS